MHHFKQVSSGGKAGRGRWLFFHPKPQLYFDVLYNSSTNRCCTTSFKTNSQLTSQQIEVVEFEPWACIGIQLITGWLYQTASFIRN